eukprot:TRINITY_DN2899_c0_g1_i9.p1 TRINITY_DN2899_c0_g1~~TRINITY_DN2899_c0_g1_i9.p1  ORF type:complete len:845 (+),score=48.57 TRINITY_DN2899_c0_g1_i9:45-2537(+)
MLQCCNVRLVPAEWRIQKAGTTLRRLYFLTLCVIATFRFSVACFFGIWDPGFYYLAVSFALLWALTRSISRPRLYEAIEVLGFFVTALLGICSPVYAVQTEDDNHIRAVPESFLLPLVVPALLGIRFWHYSALSFCVLGIHVVEVLYAVMLQGDPWNDVMFASPGLVVIGLLLSMFQNRLIWSIYAAQAELSFEKRILESLALLTCDATCWLADEIGTLVSCDSRVQNIFQADMKGKPLTNALASREDVKRLTDVLAKARRNDLANSCVTLLPITIIRAGIHRVLDLLIVDRNGCALEGVPESQLGDRRFFVGMRLGQEVNLNNQPQPAVSEDVIDVANSGNTNNADGNEELCHAIDEAHSARSHCVPSLPQTTMTGNMFKSADKQARIADCLEDIKAIAEHEKMFIPPRNIELRGDYSLGEGGFGSVFMGKFHGARVAVKLPRIDANSKGLKELSNELRILRHAHHPNLVQCFGVVIDLACCRIGLVLEFVQGASLLAFKFHMNEDMGREQRFQVIAGVAGALSYLHSRFPVIVHGDLKPENVLVDRRQSYVHPKLLDFGLSRLLTSNVRPLGGTLRWMAPEVAQRVRNHEQPKGSADIFSFGYLIYFTTTGALPYENLSRRQVMERHRSGLLADLTWSLKSSFEILSKDLAERCLQPSSEQRPSIDLICSRLMDWSNRERENEANERWRNFADRDCIHVRRDDDRLALDSAEPERFKDSSEPGDQQTLILARNFTCRVMSEDAQVQSFVELLRYWNFTDSPHRCCSFHSAVAEMQALCSRLERVPCIALPPQLRSRTCDEASHGLPRERSRARLDHDSEHKRLALFSL